jgi:integrase
MGERLPAPADLVLAGALSENTRRTYRQAIEDFFARAGIPLSEVKREHVIRYRNALMSEYAPSTVALRLSVLSQVFEEAKIRGMVEKNPLERLRRPKVSQESTTEGLTEKEAAVMLATCDRSTVKGAREDYALLKLMLYTALRRSEVCALRWGDFHQERGHWVLWVKGKGGKLRKVKLQGPVLRAVEEYIALAGREKAPEAPLFVATQHYRGEVPLSTSTVAQIVRRRVQEAGIIKRITPHSLRHTAITLALDGGASVRQAQYLAGHADPKTTMRYDRNRENLDDHGSDYIRIREPQSERPV